LNCKDKVIEFQPELMFRHAVSKESPLYVINLKND